MRILQSATMAAIVATMLCLPLGALLASLAYFAFGVPLMDVLTFGGTLNVFATCEGIGTAYVTFQLAANGPKFGCGSQVIVQQLVTSEANTGLIRVYATASAYVRWTLSGNVAP